MKQTAFFIALALPLLSACAGGGDTTVAAFPASSIGASSTLSEARSDAAYHVDAPAVSGANDLLYIGNRGNSSITVYRHDATGDTAPIATIAGSQTHIGVPGQLSQDAAGNLYVANTTPNAGGAVTSSILVFAHGANGNVAPIRILTGPATGLHCINAMTVDKTTGKIFAFDSAPSCDIMYPSETLLRFGPNAAGNQAPFARTAATFHPLLFQLASDSTGKAVIGSSECAPLNCQLARIDTFVKQYPDGAALQPTYSVGNLIAAGVADDPTTKTYLATTSLGIVRLMETTIGGRPGTGGIFPTKPAPVSTITSDTCGGQLAVAPGPFPYTYVVHANTCPGTPQGGVYVYANNAAGNARPVRVLAGAATQMSAPYGIYEGP